jgi:diaminopimelate epimerase
MFNAISYVLQTNGNDFVILEDCVQNIEAYKLIADLRFGIGCDQVVVIGRKTPTKYGLKFHNSDETEANMCGNGACAAALYIIAKCFGDPSAYTY